MKAQTALEYIKWLLQRYTVNDIDYKTFTELLAKAINFYSRPFRPEMITEYFEGWENTKDKPMDTNYPKSYMGEKFENDEDIIHFNYMDNTVIYNGVYPNPSQSDPYKTSVKIVQGENPESLNDFISDCQRAGIDLEFKPEIAKEFFE